MGSGIPAELKELPLSHIIGGPLTAAIDAQTKAAAATANFIKSVGLVKDPVTNEMRATTVEFKFDRPIEETIQVPSTTGGPPTTTKTTKIVPSKITAPLLSIVPIPFIRITDMSIDFEYQIKDVETKQNDTEAGVEGSVSGEFWGAKVEIKGSYSTRSSNKRETDRRATLRISVNAAQDNIPEGLSRVLDILHDSMRVVPTGTGNLIPTATTRIDSVDKFGVNKVATGETTADVIVKGIGFTGSSYKTDDVKVTVALQTGAGAASDTELKLKLTFTAAAEVGEKTITINTSQGSVNFKFRLN